MAAASCGLRYRGRHDLALIVLDSETAVLAGVFTRSRCPSAPVAHCRRLLSEKNREGRVCAILVNAGNANAFTGAKGRKAVEQCVDALAAQLDCSGDRVFVAATGTIGEPLDANIILQALPQLMGNMGSSNWEAVARAIMTTDTQPKFASRQCFLQGACVRLNGVAKGAAMLAPDMATMLAFIGTDANLPQSLLQRLLRIEIEDSLHCLTIDGDTSTSDSVFLFSSCRAAHAPLAKTTRPGDRRLKEFREALLGVLQDLSLQIAMDAEGARHLITVRVQGASTRKAARGIAFSIANSTLVKTAVAGSDPNWGRIIMAIGKAGQHVDPDRISIDICGIPVVRMGERAENCNEETLKQAMSQWEVDILVDLQLGPARARVWTCDLTQEYVSMNADYRT